MTPRIAIVFYSTWGHIKKLVEAEAEGIAEAGGKADIYQLPETLSSDILAKMYAPPKDSSIPTVTDPAILEQYDGFLFDMAPGLRNRRPSGTRLESSGKEVTVIDGMKKLFNNRKIGSFWGKHAGLFVSTALLCGGQESTALNALSVLTHYGIIYIPLGYKPASSQLGSLTEVHGGSPWGAGTFSGLDGSRQPSSLELEIARAQGKALYETIAKGSAWMREHREEAPGGIARLSTRRISEGQILGNIMYLRACYC